MLIRTYADIEKLEGEDALSEAERLLLSNSSIGNFTVLGDGSRPDGPSIERTIRASILRYLVAGGCQEHRVHERGVALGGAWIEGDLDLRYIKALGALNLTRCTFGSLFDARQAQFPFLQLKGSRVQDLILERIVVGGNVVLDRIESRGTVSLSGAEIGGQVTCVDGVLDGAGALALSLQGVSVTDAVFLSRSSFRGGISLVGARITGQLNCKETVLEGSEEILLNSQHAKIGASVFLNALSARGQISFNGAEINGSFHCQDISVTCKTVLALDLERVTITGSLFLNGAKIYGMLSLSATEVGTNCSFEGATIEATKGYALNAQNLKVEGGLYWRKLSSIRGRVEFASASFRQLVDDKASWEMAVDAGMVGSTYEAVFGPTELEFRMVWLRQTANIEASFHPQPYQQLAKFYRETGHRYEAREILVAKEIEQRKATRKAIRERKARSESWMQPDVLTTVNLIMDTGSRFVAGYGYKPLRSLAWIGGLVFTMMCAAQLTWNAGDFAPNSAVILTSQDWKTIADGPSQNPAAEWSDTHAPGQDYETFYSFAYALDVVVPVLDLGQTDAWAPSPARGDWGYWMFYAQKIFIVLGWVVTAIAAAAISGMIRRDD
jgi:hypothetical protein